MGANKFIFRYMGANKFIFRYISCYD